MPDQPYLQASDCQGFSRPSVFRAGRHCFSLGKKTYIMGILNITPDSFSDGGRFIKMDQALRHADELIQQGADILDIGGESTRPGGTPVSAEEELQRVLPVIERVIAELGCPVSVDTYKSEVAEAALTAGASIVNDINGFQGDRSMASVVASHQAGAVIMHNARLYRQDQAVPTAGHRMMPDVADFLTISCSLAKAAGLTMEQLIVDPGVGFGVSAEESMEMIAHLDELACLGLPVLLGPSRKRFISHVLGPDADRLNGTIAAAVLGVARGADFIRVHDVREVREAIRVTDAIIRECMTGDKNGFTI